jgi:hypothetical protein
MASKSETGHTINVANYKSQIAFNVGFGSKYAPTNDSIKLTNMQAHCILCDNATVEASKQDGIFGELIKERQIVFQPLDTLSTQIVNSFASLNLNEIIIEGAREFNRKIQGTRATPIKPKKGKSTETTDKADDPKTISASQQSYDNLVQHFEDLINWVSAQSLYKPNEAELKGTALQAYLAKLKKANKDVTDAEPIYKNALQTRDALLYSDETGLVDVALKSKKYVLSVFKSKSAEYKKVSSIPYTRPKKEK